MRAAAPCGHSNKKGSLRGTLHISDMILCLRQQAHLYQQEFGNEHDDAAGGGGAEEAGA